MSLNLTGVNLTECGYVVTVGQLLKIQAALHEVLPYQDYYEYAVSKQQMNTIIEELKTYKLNSEVLDFRSEGFIKTIYGSISLNIDCFGLL